MRGAILPPSVHRDTNDTKSPARDIGTIRKGRSLNPLVNHGDTAMLAEIFMLKAEATSRESKGTITRSTAQFVPINLPAAKATSVPTMRQA